MTIDPEAMKERMRRRDAATPVAAGVEIVHTYGHTSHVGQHPQFDAKVAKEIKRACPECRKRKHAQHEAEHAERRAANAAKRKPMVPRDTGLGCTYLLHYAGIGDWHGELVEGNLADVHGTAGGGTLIRRVKATSRNKCFDALNQAFLEWQAAPRAPAPEVPS